MMQRGLMSSEPWQEVSFPSQPIKRSWVRNGETFIEDASGTILIWRNRWLIATGFFEPPTSQTGVCDA